MSVLYGKFEMPSKIKTEEIEDSESKKVTRFIAEAFERGYGYTIGNALRRILLTSLEAPGIISIRIEGVSHEYTAIIGIIEDMTHIVLNLKNAMLRYLPTEETNGSRDPVIVTKILEVTQEQLDENNGAYDVILKDILGPSKFEIVNPKLKLFTVTKPISKRVDVRVGVGKGYVPSERHFGFDKNLDEIVLDTCFSPVRKVNYFVENTRVGQDTDFDKLILDIETDGRISPEEALNFATLIAKENLKVFEGIKDYKLAFDKKEVESNREKEEILHKLALKIGEIELSVRSTNCLSNANIDTIGELVVMPESEMLRFRNFGKKSLVEIKHKLDEMHLCLGMDLNKYGINRDNIRSVIENYWENQKNEES